MAVNPDKNIVEQSLIARLIGKIKRIALDMGDSVTAETTRATAAEGLKADKVQGATAGNLAALDASGNLTDSGKNTADFATAAQGANADSAVQGVKVNGTELSKDSNNMVDVPVPTAFAATPLKDGTASAGSSSQWARGDHVHPTDDSREAVNNKKQVVNDSSTTEYPSSKAVADFVNSSVATNTANFLGTISESSLGLDYTATNEQIALALNVHSWESTPTNNDYCFVSVNDPQTTDVDEYRRFKFNGSVWAYEYTLNNSSFTQAQWDAINSGLTSSDRTAYNAAVTLLSAHVGDGSIHVTSSEKNAWNAKQDAISDLATIRSGASAGATALQPSGNGSNLSVTPDGTSTGYDLGSSTTLKVFAQKFKNLVSALKSLAFKDKASYDDLSSGVQSSLDKADTALQSHQDISGKQNVVSTDTDSSAFGDNTAIATGFSSDKLHLNVASRLWNYIRGKILGWYDWTRVDSGTGRYAKICSIADPASGTSYTVDVLVTHMTSYYAVTGLVRITVSHGSSSVQASILASDSLFYAVDSGNPPKVYTYVDGTGKRTFVFDTASAYQTAQGFVFRAVGGFSDKWSFFGDVGCSNDAADLGSIGTKQDALDVTFGFATYAKTAGHAATATSADNATDATNAGYAYQAGNAATVNSHTVDKDVPSNAVFTDTTYSQISRGSGAGLAPGLPSGSGTSKYLREDGTWQTPPNDTYSAGNGLTLTKMNQFSVDNPFNPNGDYSSNTLRANTAISADYANSAGSATNDSTGTSIATQFTDVARRFSNVDNAFADLQESLANYGMMGFAHWKLGAAVSSYTPTSNKKYIDGWDRCTSTNKRHAGVAFLYIQNNTASTIYFDIKVTLTSASGTNITYTFTLGCFGYCGVPFTYHMDLVHYKYDFSIYKNPSLSTGSVTCYIGGLVFTGKPESTDA